MPPQIYVPGPAFIFAAPAPAVATTAPTYSYLGQTEGDLGISEQFAEEDVFVDQSGPRIPFDVAAMGKEMYVGGTLVRYDEVVWEAIAARVAGGAYMAIQAAEVGTLMRQERKFFLFAIACPYASKSAYSSMPSGYTLGCSWLHGNFDMTSSVSRRRQRFAIRAIPDWKADGSGVIATVGLPGGLPTVT